MNVVEHSLTLEDNGDDSDCGKLNSTMYKIKLNLSFNKAFETSVADFPRTVIPAVPLERQPFK